MGGIRTKNRASHLRTKPGSDARRLYKHLSNLREEKILT